MAVPRDADARRYYRAAKQRLDEAQLILEKVELPAASIYLAGYAVECMLKALLIELTAEGKRLELVESLKHRFGHSFERLKTGIAERGVNVPKDVLRELLLVADWSPQNRYEPGPGEISTATRFLKAVVKIVAWTDGKI